MRKRKIALRIVFVVVIVAIYVLLLCFQAFLRSIIGKSADILISVYALMAGALLGALINSIFKAFRFGKSTFSGYYRDEIFSIAPNEPNTIIKRDAFRLEEKENRVFSGEFFRYYPGVDALTNWECSGFIVADQLLLAYRAERETTPSRGVILVRQDTARRDGLIPRFSGKYFKFEDNHIVAYPINLVKIDESEYKDIKAAKES